MIKVYGSSDDLIEVEGDVTEEFSPSTSIGYLGFSDGTVLKYEYDRFGFWRFDCFASPDGGISISKPMMTDKEYSDVVEIANNKPIIWVVCGEQAIIGGKLLYPNR